MKDYLFSLQTDAWCTSGARYNAARRLKRRELVATVSLAFFSALTAVLAIVQRIYSSSPGTPLDNYLSTLSVCLGIFLLAISLMEWGAANGAKADALHRNAEDLNALHRKIAQRLAQIKAEQSFEWSEVDAIRAEYEIIKERCSHNHDPIDYRLFKAIERHAPEFARSNGKPGLNSFEARWVLFRHWWSSLWYFGLFWIAVLTLLILTPWSNSPSMGLVPSRILAAALSLR